MATKANKNKFGGCSGAKCSTVGNSYKAVDGPCRKGIPGALLKDLISEAAKNGADEAAKTCGQGCVCRGRFRVTIIGTLRSSSAISSSVCGTWVACTRVSVCAPIMPALTNRWA